MTAQVMKVNANVIFSRLFLLIGVFSLLRRLMKNCFNSFLKITATTMYGMDIKNKMPLFNPLATELGFASRELSAAALHMAHCE